MGEARRVCPTCGAAYGGEALFCPRDGAPLGSRKPEGLVDPYVGLSIDGRIRLERLAGLGSMGRVYRAYQGGLERPVAVKILHRELSKNETLVARFHREGRVAGGLVHPNVVAVHDAGELPGRTGRTEGTAQTDGEPYLVMEFLDGLSLRSALAGGGGALPVERALHVVLQISDAMGEAHARGIVHRDLKPENVMLVRCGADPDFVKVLDFGVARVGEADSSVATHAGAILGTATYACPESARGDRIGPPGDVYSIATLLFECLAGRPPFQGAGPVDVLIQHAQAPAPDVRSIPPALSVPEAIAQLIARNLAKSPADRAPDARAFGRALLEAARQAGQPGDSLVAPNTLLGPERRPPAPPCSTETTSVMATVVEKNTLRNLGTKGGRPG
jgi:serine/threonine protein kinase